VATRYLTQPDQSIPGFVSPWIPSLTLLSLANLSLPFLKLEMGLEEELIDLASLLSRYGSRYSFVICNLSFFLWFGVGGFDDKYDVNVVTTCKRRVVYLTLSAAGNNFLKFEIRPCVRSGAKTGSDLRKIKKKQNSG